MRQLLAAGLVLIAAIVLLLAPGVSAQTVPQSGIAFASAFPVSPIPPPNTLVPASMANVPVRYVSVPFFGPSAIVVQFVTPRRVVAIGPVGCYSGPDATLLEESDSVYFGPKPAGTRFIAFFVRGSRTYTYDTSVGDYCWIDSNYTP